MHYGEIKNCDIANGLGVRVTLFVSGCTNHCENCFQPQTWDFCYGKPFTSETEDELIRLLSPDYINGLTLLGGEPFEPKNQRALLPFLRRVRRELPQKTIWSFTGFTWEDSARPHRVFALRGDGRTAVTARCARRRALCGRAARYLAALSRLVEPAYHRRSENAAIRYADALGRAREHLKKHNKSAGSILRQILTFRYLHLKRRYVIFPLC